ncbi:MAG: hypothetical protein ACOX8S_09485 [Christensenellales bacterium]
MFYLMKAGEKEMALSTAKNLPRARESREAVLAQLEKELSVQEIDECLRHIT